MFLGKRIAAAAFAARFASGAGGIAAASVGSLHIKGCVFRTDNAITRAYSAHGRDAET